MSGVLPIITARGGSKGVPRKNIRLLDGKPLIAYTIECALALGARMRQVIVSTDDEEIAEVSRSFGADVPFFRPPSLSQDDTPSLPVVQHAVRLMEQRDGRSFDWIMLLQPTSPLRRPEDLSALLNSVNCDGDATSAVTVTDAMNYHPLKLRRINDGWLEPVVDNAREGIRRQDMTPIVYKTNGAGYLSRRDVVMESNSLYGPRIRPVVMPPERSIDIDTETDFLFAEVLMKRLKESVE